MNAFVRLVTSYTRTPMFSWIKRLFDKQNEWPTCEGSEKWPFCGECYDVWASHWINDGKINFKLELCAECLHIVLSRHDWLHPEVSFDLLDITKMPIEILDQLLIELQQQENTDWQSGSANRFRIKDRLNKVLDEYQRRQVQLPA